MSRTKKKGLVVIDGREYSEAEWKLAFEELYRTRFRVAIEILVMTRDRFLQNNEFTYEQLDRLWSLLENVITLSQDGLNSLGKWSVTPKLIWSRIWIMSAKPNLTAR